MTKLGSRVMPCSGGLVIRKKFSQVQWQGHRSCTSAFQDARYGPGQRLHTEMLKDGQHKGFRCTVCGFTR